MSTPVIVVATPQTPITSSNSMSITNHSKTLYYYSIIYKKTCKRSLNNSMQKYERKPLYLCNDPLVIIIVVRNSVPVYSLPIMRLDKKFKLSKFIIKTECCGV